MAVKCSSSGGNSAMKASLVLMLLFGSVVAAHATHDVEFYNGLCVDIVINGVVVKAGHLVTLKVNVNVQINVTDLLGKVLAILCPLLGDVTKVSVVEVNHLVVLKVTAVDHLLLGLGGVLTNIGALLCSLQVPNGLPCPVVH